MSSRSESCAHFNGFQNEACEAGVNYLALAGKVDGMALRMPCCGAIRRTQTDSISCEKFRLPTPEETKAEDDAIAAAVARVVKIGPWVTSVKKLLPNGGSGVDVCPICKRVIQFSVAKNHHMRAQCETQDCVNFIE